MAVMPKIGRAQNDISAANVSVVQVDTNNTVDSVEMTATTSINGLHIRGDSNRADYNLQAGDDYADDVFTGVLISSVAQKRSRQWRGRLSGNELLHEHD